MPLGAVVHCYKKIKENKSRHNLLSFYGTSQLLTFGGDWSREIFLVDGTGFASEMGSVLGRGGLEFDGALLYLDTKNRQRTTKNLNKM